MKCNHYFILPEPNKYIDFGTPFAKCEHCGIKRMFSNSIIIDFNKNNNLKKTKSVKN